MKEDFFIILIIGSLMLIAVLIFVLERIKRKKIMEYCEKHRFMYDRSPASMIGTSDAYDVLMKGERSYYSDGMFGKRGDIEINIVDFECVSGHGKHRSHWSYTLCQLYKPNVYFPVFFIRDENAILDTLGSMLGGQDIDFDEDKVFSRKFVLQGLYEEEIRKFFNSKVRNAFTKFHKYGYCYESKGNCFLLYISGCASLEKRLEMMESALKIYKDISNTGYTPEFSNDIPRNPKYYG